VHLQIVEELRRLGMLQKRLFSQGDANGERYGELILEIQDAVKRVGDS
jgi:hypothetical protein